MLWSEFKGKSIPRVGASSLGKPGKPAEVLEGKLQPNLVLYITSCPVQYTGDQSVPTWPSWFSQLNSQTHQAHLTNIYAAENSLTLFSCDGSLGEVTVMKLIKKSEV